MLAASPRTARLDPVAGGRESGSSMAGSGSICAAASFEDPGFEGAEGGRMDGDGQRRHPRRRGSTAADPASGKTRILPRPPDFHIPTFPLIAFLPDHAELEGTNIGPRPCNTSSAPHPHTAVCGPKLTCRASDRFTISDLDVPQYCIDGIRSSSFDTRLLRRPVSFFVVRMGYNLVLVLFPKNTPSPW